jgi:hypothetical protein
MRNSFSQIVWVNFRGAQTDYAGEILTINQVSVADSQISEERISGIIARLNALFIDEKAYRNFPLGHPLSDSVNNTRVAMGNTGIPFDMYMVEDAQAVLHKYKIAIFTTPKPSESGKKALEFCKNSGIQYIASTEEKPSYSTNELRNILTKSGVHCYNSDNCVIYCGNGFLGVHTVCDGETKVVLPHKMKIRPFGTTQEGETEAEFITFTAPKHTTKLFELL